ncbi:DarT ssDNA thymidine ADP-ribosyltransferase family protein [Lonsdalea quercina]|uniref:DarT ssDNA thymidine ADP-ribosyltransferase family protein n=1 Tax=Lonsdalea quercina TaxID=71657 RepID=UPI0039768165
MPREQIRLKTERLQIPFLVHFTRAVNLPSIMKHGLVSVSEAGELGITPEINDELRLDGHRDSTSLSIAFPNYRMFYRYRMDNPGVEWAVLGIHPSIIWRNECAYCCHNAADARISIQSLAQLKTLGAFDSMFAEIDGLESRQEQRLNNFDPTDGQAEVLSFDTIEPQFIFAAIFNNEATKNLYQHVLGNRQILVNSSGSGYFASRSYVR